MKTEGNKFLNMLALKRSSNKANHGFESRNMEEQIWCLAGLPLTLLLESRCRICSLEEISMSADGASTDM